MAADRRFYARQLAGAMNLGRDEFPQIPSRVLPHKNSFGLRAIRRNGEGLSDVHHLVKTGRFTIVSVYGSVEGIALFVSACCRNRIAWTIRFPISGRMNS
jgi:hypothetical protein